MNLEYAIARMLKRLSKPFMGKKRFQKYFEYLNRFSLEGMNIGVGGGVANSGEEEALKEIKKQLIDQENYILFDVGANKGDYSLCLNKIFGPGSKIYSFEPSRKTFEALELNIGQFENIKAYNFGFGDKEEQVELFSNADGSGLASVFDRKLDHVNIKLDKTETIQLRTLDSFCSENNIRNIDLLKLDVEGNEFNTLKGAMNTINNGMVKFIQFEFGGTSIDSRTFFLDFHYFLNTKYRIFRIVQDGLHEITQYKEEYEACLAVNYLASLRDS